MKKVLIVDDHVDAGETLALLLRALNHEVRTAHSGEEALRVLRRYRPEVIFMDIGLPGKDGYEIARIIRSRRALKGVLLVALTGWGQERDRRRAREAGFDVHLTKPASLEAIRELLER